VDWITNAVAIGTRDEAQDAASLAREGIRSVLCLDGTLAEEQAAALGLAEIVVVPLRDGSGNDVCIFRRAVEALVPLTATREPVLVHCEYGRSRSPAVVAGYLMATQRLDPLRARAYVASKRDISMSAALLPFLFQL
jgi:protein-tyrosine phosphatase